MERVHRALRTATEALLAELRPEGHWVGELSSSPLSTATAVIALATVDPQAHAGIIESGLRWLAENQRPDGGWGDTVKSKANISTSALCWAAFGAAHADHAFHATVLRAQAWLADATRNDGARSPARVLGDSLGRPKEPPLSLVAAIERRYGRDRTFSVPILMTLALSGRLGPAGWREVIPLPFELAALPHQLFGALQLPVVSYALPALIAIGQVIHHHHPTRNPLARFLREGTRAKTLRVLESIQPESGGFLEATPLTSFVTMSLAAMNQREHAVTRKGVAFLCASVRADGSWPIDTNLATWVTTLSIKALAHQASWATPEQRRTLREWLLGQQYRVQHPYTHAAPGGWAWTHLPGGVPDADDTPGALLALLQLGPLDATTRAAGRAGVSWLLGLQNRDGGLPTFCRGWGALPFDRSSPDLTAHTLRAWSAWLPELDPPLRERTLRALPRALRFLAKAQRADGAWIPLWFGNEDAPDDENPTYGTAQVLIALREVRDARFAPADSMLRRARAWFTQMQNDDGGWSGVKGGRSSVEETALAVEALAGAGEVRAVEAGVRWLLEAVESGAWREPTPIGFYFAKLWYYERLYPLIFTASALGRVAQASTL
ncbi:MAG: squalene--hopene cyclase [Verrucomicrobiota bacterium]|nr:squalene--hopene cyclase [Verrucomicrobiota bacterium]